MPVRVFFLALLAACEGADGADGADDALDVGSGSVSITGMDAFGAVGSAVWHREVTDAAVIDRVLLTTEAGACEKVRAYSAAEDAYNAIDHEGDPDWCANVEEAARAYREARAALFPTGSHLVSINLANTESTGSLWSEGTWSETGGTFYASAFYVEDDGLDRYDTWDVTGTYEDGCGMALGGEEAAHAIAREATLEVSSVVTSERTTGALEGELQGFGADPSAVEVTFDAVWCEVE